MQFSKNTESNVFRKAVRLIRREVLSKLNRTRIFKVILKAFAFGVWKD